MKVVPGLSVSYRRAFGLAKSKRRVSNRVCRCLLEGVE